MSSFSVLRDVGAVLREHIVRALETTPDVSFQINGQTDRIQLAPPSKELPDQTLATLYLYQVEIDPHLRNQRPVPDRANDALFQKAPLPLYLRFLFTPVAADEETNLLLLGRVMQHFHDNPTVTRLAGDPIDDSHGVASTALRVKPDVLSFEQLSQFWNARQYPFRLSMGFLVDTVAIDSALPPTRAPRAEEVAVAVGIMEGARR